MDPVTPSSGPSPSAPLVLAGFIGTTRSRVVLAPVAAGTSPVLDLDGPGATPGARPEQKLDLLGATAHRAIDALREERGAPPHLVAVSLGVHGLAHTELEAAQSLGEGLFSPLARPAIPASRIVVGRGLLTSFLAGGVGDSGLLVRAGTGAVAVRIEDRRVVARRDGMGPLLGDVGSAVWIGRRTLQVVAADIDGRGRRTLLTERLGDMLDLDLRDGLLPPSPTGDVRDDLARAIARIAPPGNHAELGRFATLPGTVPEDPTARDILDAVVRHVTETVRQLDPALDLPVVLAGSVLATPGPIHDELVTGFEAAGREHREAIDGLPGALQLAREAATAGV